MYNNTILINRKFKPQGLLLVYILCLWFFPHFLNVFDSFCWALNSHNKLTKTNKIKLVLWIFTKLKEYCSFIEEANSTRLVPPRCIKHHCFMDFCHICSPWVWHRKICTTSLLCHWDLRLKRFFLRKSAPMSPKIIKITNIDLLNLYRFYKSIQ